MFNNDSYNFLSVSSFIPHGHCYLWRPTLVTLHTVSDLSIALAYYSIPLTLFYFVRKRDDLPFNWMFWRFGIFIIACGTTHIMEVWTIWHPQYWLSGLIKAITAYLSLYTAVELLPLVPKALALPSPAHIEATNQELKREIAERLRVEEALRHSYSLLQAVIETLPDYLFAKDFQGHYVTINSSHADFIGKPISEILGKTDAELWPPQVARQFREKDVQIMTTGVAETFEQEIYNHEGIIQVKLTTKSPWRDVEGNIIGIIGISRDISEQQAALRERKLAEETLKQQKELLQTIFDHIPVMVAFFDTAAQLKMVNREWERVLGWKLEELQGRDMMAEFYPDSDYRQAVLEYIRVTRGQWRDFKTKIRDGRVLDTCWANVQLSDGTSIGIGQDITERKLAETALQQANEQLTSLVSNLKSRNQEMRQLMEMSDVLQACLTLEEAYRAIAQLVPPMFSQVEGSILVANDSKKVMEVVATWGNHSTSQKSLTLNDCWALRRGRVYWVANTSSGLLCQHLEPPLPAQSVCVPMLVQDEAIGLLCLKALVPGYLTEEKQQFAVAIAEHLALALANLALRETLQYERIHDSLTGLFNRRFLEESLERELLRAERKQHSLGIIMLDIDYFKQFNDTFGHAGGDAVLRELGTFLKRSIRGSDLACRYGGEELTLILPEANLENTYQRAEQLRVGAKQLRVEHEGRFLGGITLSLGVACYPEHGITGETLLQAADAALYQAKAEGRDRVSVCRS